MALKQTSTVAYKNFRPRVYDLVILDIKMPIVDGFQLYQKITRTDSREQGFESIMKSYS
jgi:YesN/AraC family two-component response regulator